MYPLPESFDTFFWGFDNTGIRLIQRFRYPALKHIANFITLLTSIEILLIAPVILFAAGQDEAALMCATQAFVMSLLSQVPKRFTWRDRPWMQRRAFPLRRDKTSSFPSRAVACSVVDAFVLMFWGSGALRDRVHWAYWVVLALFPPLAAWARIVLGSHFPSDCLVGYAFGLACALMAWGAARLISSGAGAATARGWAYVEYVPNAVSWASASGSSFWQLLDWPVALTIGACGLVVLWAMLMRPFRFWNKALFSVSFTAVSLAFYLSLLAAPGADRRGALLSPPRFPAWEGLLFGVCVVAVAIALMLVLKPNSLQRWMTKLSRSCAKEKVSSSSPKTEASSSDTAESSRPLVEGQQKEREEAQNAGWTEGRNFLVGWEGLVSVLLYVIVYLFLFSSLGCWRVEREGALA